MGKTYKDQKGQKGVFRLNLHAEVFGDKRTKRNRTRREQKRKAIAEHQ